MTSTLLTPPPVSAASSRSRAVLRTVAMVSCLPYLAIKTAWIAGSHVGMPEDSTLLDHRGAMIAANSASLLLDSCVIVLALLLTQDWGRRVPAWLLALPMWVATGLLAPVMTGYPLQLLVHAVNGPAAPAASPEPFLDEWVFGVVYTGFILQGLALGSLFVLYAGDRWGQLWRGRMRELPVRTVTGSVQRVAATAAALFALLPGVMHLLWACGVRAGLSSARVADRSADYYALEAVYAFFAAVTVAGVLMLAFRRGSRVPVKVPLALAWVGSGAMACWGGWILAASLPGSSDPGKLPTQLMSLTYAVQMIVGMLVVVVGACFLAERDT
ncbi:hypothetical protein AB0M87_23080 [Streptomyces sp. NPDC051320]|uniref:hypothetical protein n=1 Tax=Streptomyces sp. NPDC051320 TaxID=3154644 RepID=UPI00341A8FD4